MFDLSEDFYVRWLRPLLFRLDSERAHRWTLGALRAAGLSLERYAPEPPELATSVLGLKLRNPLGLAAGMDKDVRAPLAWMALGFGFAEFGTITPRPQPGNPRPRMWRLARDRALINRLGFPGEGMEVAAGRLAQLRHFPPVLATGVNFGPNKDTPVERVADDYAAMGARLSSLADFIVVNLSSPNTPGLREWQAPDRMREIVEAVRAAETPAGTGRPPILVKLSPDLEPALLHQICDAALALRIDGIVATNTTLARAEVGVESALAGGLSGEPLKLRARAVIAEIYRITRGKLPIIGVGGVSSAADAYGHIRAGASLVELYTGLVYRGPGLVRSIREGLAGMLQRDGLRSVGEAVGLDTRT